MISDKFLFRQSEKVLDKIERFASCYDFKSKEVLQIRLLTEEVISVISPTLTLSDGRCWISTDEQCFSVTIDCDAGINGLEEDTRKQLMQMSRSGKNKGIFGMIGKVFEYLDSPMADYGAMVGHRMFYPHGMGAEFSGYYWNPDIVSILPYTEPVPKKEEKKNSDHDIEISIIEGYADDIRVCLQKYKTGARLEITVVKNFISGQTAEIEF